jgi:LSD1 subclass zinc finger protein
MGDSQLKKVACPSCGAPLLFGAGEITIRCTFCNAVVERPLQADQPATLKTGPAARPPTSRRPPSSPSAVKPAFGALAVFLGVLLAAGIALWAVFLIGHQVSSSGFELHMTGPAVPVPTEQSEGPDIIAFAYDLPGESYLFVRVNPIEGKVIWRGKHFKSISDVQTIAAEGNAFFVVEDRELSAYSAADGAELWRAELSDKLGYCRECLSVADGRAVVLTQDYVIEAFDTETGTSAWKRRMAGYTGGFTIADGGLWVIDEVDGRSSLFRLSLADGSTERRITPECVRQDGFISSELYSSSMFLFDPDPAVRSPERSVYLLYGWSPSCVERWDAAGVEPAWQTEEDNGYSPSSDFATLLTPETLFFAYDGIVWSVSKADGQVRMVVEDEDYDLVPWALEQGALILRTKRTRGTTQYGLRGVDPQSGGTIWEHAIENAEPLDPPDAAFAHVDDDRSIWTGRLIEGRIRLAVFRADPNQIAFETIDPKDGSTSGESTLGLGCSGDSYFGPEVIVWKDTVVWFIAASKLMAVDISTAELIHHFP